MASYLELSALKTLLLATGIQRPKVWGFLRRIGEDRSNLLGARRSRQAGTPRLVRSVYVRTYIRIWTVEPTCIIHHSISLFYCLKISNASWDIAAITLLHQQSVTDNHALEVHISPPRPSCGISIHGPPILSMEVQSRLLCRHVPSCLYMG